MQNLTLRRGGGRRKSIRKPRYQDSGINLTVTCKLQLIIPGRERRRVNQPPSLKRKRIHQVLNSIVTGRAMEVLTL